MRNNGRISIYYPDITFIYTSIAKITQLKDWNLLCEIFRSTKFLCVVGCSYYPRNMEISVFNFENKILFDFLEEVLKNVNFTYT